MKDKPFRFRYTNELAGLFVILAIFGILAAVWIAGRVQGWFEGNIQLHTAFDSEEGAFGLQEGGEVTIRNARAGSVGKIVPTPTGGLTTTFIIQKRFHPFIRKDSVATVKKKLGLAGDAFVEIGVGKGDPIVNGDTIECRKAEDIAETAQRLLRDLQATTIPILEETHGTLKNVNQITAALAQGKGLAGSIINDPQLTTDARTTIANLNKLLVELASTSRETRRLVEGFQRHWLVRSYIKKETFPPYLLPLQVGDVADTMVNDYRAELDQAMMANASPEIARTAYNLAILMLEQNRIAEAESLRREIRVEAAGTPENRVLGQLLEAELVKRRAGPREGVAAAQMAVALLDKKCSPELKTYCQIRVAHFMSDLDRTEDLKAAIREGRSILPSKASPLFEVELQWLDARKLETEGKAIDAGRGYDSAAALLQDSGLYRGMAGVLERSGQCWESVQQDAVAADRYYRAGRSFILAGRPESGQQLLNRAEPLARKTNLSDLVKQIEALRTQNTAEPKPPTPAEPNPVKPPGASA